MSRSAGRTHSIHPRWLRRSRKSPVQPVDLRHDAAGTGICSTTWDYGSCFGPSSAARTPIPGKETRRGEHRVSWGDLRAGDSSDLSDIMRLVAEKSKSECPSAAYPPLDEIAWEIVLLVN